MTIVGIMSVILLSFVSYVFVSIVLIVNSDS